MVENLPVKQQMWVIYPGWEGPLEKEMTNLSSILAWRIPMDREVWRAAVPRVTKVLDMTQQLNKKNICVYHKCYDAICMLPTFFFPGLPDFGLHFTHVINWFSLLPSLFSYYCYKVNDTDLVTLLYLAPQISSFVLLIFPIFSEIHFILK